MANKEDYEIITGTCNVPLSDEMWEAFDNALAEYDNKALENGVVLKDTEEDIFILFKKSKYEDKILIQTYNNSVDVETSLLALRQMDMEPPCYSRKYDCVMIDQIWRIEGDKIINPMTQHACKITKSKVGKVVLAQNPISGPFYVLVPGTDTEEEGNYDCAAFLQIDGALEFIENKLWKKPKSTTEEDK